LPSPIHFQLPIMTRLTFNEQGQITYHGNIWDVCDMLRLIPGVLMVQWFVGRAGKWGLSWIGEAAAANGRLGQGCAAERGLRGAGGGRCFLTSAPDSVA
ncbi:hypothetical protein BU15DRAFT_50930, partial [Melanogaster broomeanus]